MSFPPAKILVAASEALPRDIPSVQPVEAQLHTNPSIGELVATGAIIIVSIFLCFAATAS